MDLSLSGYRLIVLLGHKWTGRPSMSTIELVDPELRDTLALWPLLPLTAESLTRRRANALELIGAVPKPNLPDITTGGIHVEKKSVYRVPPQFRASSRAIPAFPEYSIPTIRASSSGAGPPFSMIAQKSSTDHSTGSPL